ncbi:MAG TPA: thiol-disulfide oxidoreductase DCC family protein [Chitinophagaceae bacterium]|nr:thiol-disulfide oxidoreductase DCC family protein [Chitinophagaceae bacterium]
MHFINNGDGAVKIQYSFLKSQLYFCSVDKKKPLVLFDGVCNFCNYWVNFAIKRDKKGKLMFSPLQGKTAKEKLTHFNFNQKTLSSVILVDKGKIFTQSSAAIRICRYLDGGWKLLYGLIVIPKFIRDFFYNIIARNRYKWFGKKEECMVPSPELKERFLK